MVYPDYYPEFSCVAGACQHSCCVGWEIDIDEEALARFDRVEGELGKRLKENISMEEIPHFVLREGERCPFLNEKGLCDLILELGLEGDPIARKILDLFNDKVPNQYIGNDLIRISQEYRLVKNGKNRKFKRK